MFNQFKFPIMIMGLFVSYTAAAHPGHGVEYFSIVHAFNNPVYMAIGFCVALSLVTAIAWRRRTRLWSRRTFYAKTD